jgi:hypothetical protein
MGCEDGVIADFRTSSGGLARNLTEPGPSPTDVSSAGPDRAQALVTKRAISGVNTVDNGVGAAYDAAP